MSTLRTALQNLLNEANGIAEMARPSIGNTNVECLLTRCAEARAALAQPEPVAEKYEVGIQLTGAISLPPAERGALFVMVPGQALNPGDAMAPSLPPAAETALERFNASWLDEESGTDPVERLRFFCSCAMKGQDWLDVEPFFDALTGRPPAAEKQDERARFEACERDWYPGVDLRASVALNGYADEHVHHRWIGWRAALAQSPADAQDHRSRLNEGENRIDPKWNLETGTGGFGEKGSRWVCVRYVESQCGQDFYEDRDPLMFAFLSSLPHSANMMDKDGVDTARDGRGG